VYQCLSCVAILPKREDKPQDYSRPIFGKQKHPFWRRPFSDTYLLMGFDLVGGFKTFFIFHFVYGIILPVDFHMFQDGYCTTNQ
jgi:hypothetical protein